MKRITYLTCTLIVACMVAAIYPTGTKPAGESLHIKGTAGLVKERINFPSRRLP